MIQTNKQAAEEIVKKNLEKPKTFFGTGERILEPKPKAQKDQVKK